LQQAVRWALVAIRPIKYPGKKLNRIFRLLLLIPLWTLSVAAGAITIEIDGLNQELKQNLLLHIGEIKTFELSQPIRLSRMLEEATRQALQPYGYYHAELTNQVEGDLLRLSITPGPRVHVIETDITISDEASGQKEFLALLKSTPLQVGKPLVHADYNELRENLLDLCKALGFFDARYSEFGLYVNPQENSARPVLHLESGPRYRFGTFKAEGSALDIKLLTSIADFKPGEPFIAEKVTQLERQLRNTNYFDVVRVQTQPGDGAIVDVIATLEDIKTTRYEIGVGFSTDTRFRIRLNHLNPRMNDSGHSMETVTRLSAPEQSLEGTYRSPLTNPLDDFLQISGGIMHTEIKDTQSTTISTGIRKVKTLSNQWGWSYGLSTEYENYTVGDESQKKVFYLMPGASLSHTRLNPGFDPLSGSHYWLSGEFSTTGLGADSDFIRLRNSNKWLIDLGNDNTTLLTRIELGAILTDEFGKIPASLRFYAGGDGSIRGYDYESLSPLDENGALFGGQYQAIGSLEVSHRVWRQWRIAAFVDGGSAFNQSSDEFYQSAGFGVRWLSPLGQIRLDVGIPIGDDQHSGFKIHISMGPPI
jgi:translocation and assembly module TamA